MGYKDKSSKNSQEDLNELEKANDRLKIENKRLNFQIEENTKNQLKNFIKFTSQSIVLYNHQGEITFVNQNFSDLFGYPTDALIGSQLSELFFYFAPRSCQLPAGFNRRRGSYTIV